jgi:hypothetical protein
MILMLFIISFIILVIFLVCYMKKENLTPPWDIETCKLKCIEQGQEQPWNAGRTPWHDPAMYPSSTFDVAGCLRECDLETWYY